MHVGIANPRWRGKRTRHSRRMRNRNFTYLIRGPLHPLWKISWSLPSTAKDYNLMWYAYFENRYKTSITNVKTWLMLNPYSILHSHVPICVFCFKSALKHSLQWIYIFIFRIYYILKSFLSTRAVSYSRVNHIIVYVYLAWYVAAASAISHRNIVNLNINIQCVS